MKFDIENEKYWMIKEDGLYRIYAKRDFRGVRKGDRGGLIEGEYNLTVSGNAWVSGKAKVYGNAKVFGLMKTDGFIKWFSRVGSKNGILTITKHEDTGVMVSRGCFVGTLEEFKIEVKQKPKDCPYRKEYLGLIKVIKNY